MEKTEDVATPGALGFATWATAAVVPASAETGSDQTDETGAE